MDHKIRCGRAFAALIGFLSFAVGNGSSAAGDPKRGAQVFQACMACHSVKPGDHMTGPSLTHIWNHKAGTAEGFLRYSDALKHADIVWNEPTPDKWLANPERSRLGRLCRAGGNQKLHQASMRVTPFKPMPRRSRLEMRDFS